MGCETRERVEPFNALTPERQTAELDRMRRELADRCVRDPEEITRSLQRLQNQEKGERLLRSPVQHS